MSSWIILVDSLRDFDNAATPHKVITAKDYLARPQLFEFENNTQWLPRGDFTFLGEPLHISPENAPTSRGGGCRNNFSDRPYGSLRIFLR